MKKNIIVYLILILLSLWCTTEWMNIPKKIEVTNNKKISESQVVKNNKKNIKKNIKNITTWKWIWVWKISNSQRIGSKMSWQELYDNYNQQDILINFLKDNWFKKAYIFIGSIQRENDKYFSKNKLYNEVGLYRILKKLNQENIKVYALYYINDDPNSFEWYENIKNIINTITNWDKKYTDAKFVWIQNDQEVYNTNKYWEYIKMLEYIYNLTKNTKIINWIAVRPSWLYEEFNWKKIIEIISQKSDEIFLMDYYDDIDKIKNNWNIALNLWKNINIWLETWFENVTNQNTFNEEIKNNWILWFNQIVNNIENEFNKNQKFKWISIHDYNQYFQLINQKEPYLYK